MSVRSLADVIIALFHVIENMSDYYKFHFPRDFRGILCEILNLGSWRSQISDVLMLCSCCVVLCRRWWGRKFEMADMVNDTAYNTIS